MSPNAAHAFGGIWRLTLRRFFAPGRWLTVGIGLSILGLIAYAAAHRGAQGGFIDWVIGFYTTFLVPALAFVAAGGAIRDEMKSGTVDYVLTRPVPRPAFIGFRFVAHTFCAQLDFLLALGVVLTIGTVRGVPDLLLIVPKLLLGQVLLVTAFSAFGFLCGVFTSRYVILGIFYAGVIEAGVGQIPTQLSRLSMTRQMRDLLTALLHPLESQVGAPGLVGTAGVLLLFAAVTLAAAAALFTWRELSSAAET